MTYTHFYESNSQHTVTNITYLSFSTYNLTYLFPRSYKTALLLLAERYGHYRDADKSLARPGRKKATVTKL